ncbi:unnamed protein product [Durusdinium trenchii]|uniref:Uncharacterized protein n=1 Tax=Durusdinium trenchii TaxID=1381693 RepID=A0ABP0IGG8_9DINO
MQLSDVDRFPTARGLRYGAEQQIAVNAMAARLPPSLENLDEVWAKLQKSEDLTSEIPDSRWDGDFYCCLNDEVPGKVYTLRGGWLQERLLFGFDYKYFHMHRSEAQSMDPQFRMMLECIAEMKHGWTTPNNDGRIACIMGQTSNEYLAASTLHESQTQTGRFTNTGTNTCMLGNRACFEFNFRGPSFTCDTACSSALYATILCCQQIEDGCWGGVAGGANACLLPMTTIGFCKAGMLSRSGRCKSFDASADGYARAEGAGCVFLESVDGANFHWAFVRGRGVMLNDGKTSGVAVPSLQGQIGMFRDALKRAEIDASKVGYVEAHAPGTWAGDQVESIALGKTMGRSKESEYNVPLPIGSVKSNMGHLEGASGIAGIIKLVLMMRHERLVPLCPSAFQERREDVPWDSLGIFPLAKDMRWPQGPVGFVSSFGFGGAGAVCGFERPQKAENLQSQFCFVFSGMGTQEPKMLQKLPGGLRPLLDSMSDHLKKLGFSYDLLELEDEIDKRKKSDQDDTDLSQVAIFAHQVCLAHWLIEMGVKPRICIGHSLGEVAAFYVAERISLETAVAIIYHRARRLSSVKPGRMMAMMLDDGDNAQQIIQRVAPDLAVAAYNSAKDCVVAGTEESIQALKSWMSKKGKRFVELHGVKKAFHSQHVQEAADHLVRDVSGLDLKPPSRFPRRLLVSTVTGRYVETANVQPAEWATYWGRNLEQQVVFSQGIKTILQDSPGATFIELAGRSHLSRYIEMSTPKPRCLKISWLPGGFALRRPWDREIMRLRGSIMEEQVLWPVQNEHPLLGAALDLAIDCGRQQVFENAHFSIERAPWMADHVIQGQVICPGMAFVEIFVECARQTVEVELPDIEICDIHFETTLAMKMAKSVKTHTCFDLLGRNITFHSMAERNGKKWQRHCRATVAHNDAPCVHKCDLQKKANGWPSISSEELYKKLSDFFQLHRTFQGIRKLFHQAGQTEVICEISLDEGERRRAQSFNIHPALLDSIIQSGLGLICVSGGDFRGVPFHLGKFRLMKRRENFPCDLRTWCQGRSVDNGFYLNVQAFDMNGEIVCSVQDLFFKNIWALVPSPTVKLDLEWRKLWGDDLEAVSMNVDKQHWLVIWPGQEEFSELTLFEGIKQVVRATLVREFPLESAALKGITHTAVIAESQMTQDPMLYLDKAFHFIRFYQSCDGLGRSLSITLITQGGVALPDEEQDVDPIQNMIGHSCLTMAHETNQLAIRWLDMPHVSSMGSSRKECVDAVARCLIQWPRSSSELVLRFEKDGAQLFGASLRETPWEATSPLICLETAPLEHTLDLKPGLSFSVQQQSGVYVLTWSGGETFPLPFDIDPHSVLRRLKDWLVPALLRQFDMEGQLVLLQGIVGDLEINRLDKFCQKMKCTRILLIHNELDSSPQSCGKVLMVSPTDILEHVVKFDNDTGFINLAGSDEVFAQIGSLCSGHVTNLNSLSLRAICKLLPESIRLILQEDLMMRSFDAQQTTPLPGASVQVRSDGTYVVAGGTRGLGLQLARWLKDHGGKNVVIMGRHRPEDLPDMLLFEECDITDADLVREVLSKVPSPVCGLISVATEYHDKPLVEVKCAEDLSRAIKAKTLCSLHLHQASQNLNLDRNIDFLAISSIATLFGSHSQAGYVMANGYVQGLMQHRRAKGLRGCYMNVGVVSDVGFAADHPQIIRDWQRRGIAPVSSDKVCLAIGRLLMSGRNSLAFSCKADTRSYFQAFPHLVLNMEKRGNLSRLRGLMTREEFQDLRNLLEDAGDLRQRLGIMSAEDKEEFVKEQVAKVVKSKLDINDFSEGDPLEDLGLTSQTASMIRQDLNAKFRVNLEQMLVLTAGVPEIASGILSHLESQSEGNRWWQLIGNQVTNPSSLLLCMPPNASGTSVYKSWLQHTTVPVVCGTPPGWADRLEEGCVENWSDLIQTFFNELQHFLQHHGWGEVPLVLYGHSFGALIVAALAERLERECKEVQHLGIGAWCAPQKSYRERYPEHMKVDFEKLKDPKVDLLFAKEELRHFEFLPEEFFTHSDGAILQTARCVAASLKMLQQSWACPKLTCPITAFCGTHDPFVTDKDMQGWNGSSAHFCLRTIEGGHAFVHARGKDICQEILAQHVR